MRHSNIGDDTKARQFNGDNTEVSYMYNGTECFYLRAGGQLLVPNLTLPGTEGTGIFMKESTIVDSDVVVPWRDLEGPIDVRGVGANDPTWEQIGATGFYAYNFAIDDRCSLKFHVPHDYWTAAPGFFIHAHWLTDGTNTSDVVFEWKLSYAAGYGQEEFALGTPVTVTATQPGSGTAYTHVIAESALVDDFTPEIDGLIIATCTRITNGGANNPDNVYLLTSDIHYQTTGVGTVLPNTPFYATPPS